MLERTLQPEIAARDHHAIGDSEDRVEIRDRFRPLDLRDQRNGGPGAIRNRSRFENIVWRLHEAESNEIDAELQAESQVLRVLGRDRAGGQPDARGIDAFVLSERSAVDDARHDLVAAPCRATRSSMRPSSSSRRSPGFTDGISAA